MEINLTLSVLLADYQAKKFTVHELMAELCAQSDLCVAHNIWIYRLSKKELKPYLDAVMSVSESIDGMKKRAVFLKNQLYAVSKMAFSFQVTSYSTIICVI